MTRQDTAAREGAAKKAKNSGGKYAALSMIALYAFAVLAVLLAVSVFVRHSTQQGAALRALYTPPSPAAAQAADPDPAGEEKPAVIPARFEELYEINPELIGWLRVGALVDEPVVYRDNEYYLHHSFRGNASNSGTVFADVENDRWAHDAYVVLYGHNIRGGDKFGPLAQYRELDCLKENPLISWDTISGDDAALYAVFSVFDASMLPDSEDYFYLRRFDELRTGGEMIGIIVNVYAPVFLFVSSKAIPTVAESEQHIRHIVDGCIVSRVHISDLKKCTGNRIIHCFARSDGDD